MRKIATAKDCKSLILIAAEGIINGATKNQIQIIGIQRFARLVHPKSVQDKRILSGKNRHILCSIRKIVSNKLKVQVKTSVLIGAYGSCCIQNLSSCCLKPLYLLEIIAYPERKTKKKLKKIFVQNDKNYCTKSRN